MKRRFLFFCFFLTLITSVQSQVRKPALGLTLSGGGAKGLAHIGILKAMDSAGLRVDYLTGTSMGSIIGSLYAIGYSGDSIAHLASNINWDILLTNQSSLRSIVMEEKSEYTRYAIELPWYNHKFHLPSGVLEAEELWLKFSEVLFPVYATKDFSKFSIPFKCIGTNIATGQAVVLEKGEIITAVRASMAIPSVFTAVDVDGQKLVDGGVVRNFPVRDVIDMGADYTIGIDVSSGLLAADKISNALQVLMQITFFKEAEDSKKEIPLCNLYIPMPLEDYSAGSFGRAKQIMDSGIIQGRKLYPRFKELADSLNAIYGSPPPPRKPLPNVDSVFISSCVVKGLKHTTQSFFLNSMNFHTGHYYTPMQLSAKIRKTFGTRYYDRIVYLLEPQPDGSAQIVFEAKENPLNTAKLGINYNSFSGISLIVNMTGRNFVVPNSRSLVTVDIGENFRARAEHLEYMGKRKDFAGILGVQYETFKITTYESGNKYEQDGLYKSSYVKAEAKFQHSSDRNFTVGIGLRYENIGYNPVVPSLVDVSGHLGSLTGSFYVVRNTLDRTVYPSRGWKMDAVADLVFAQTGDLQLLQMGKVVLDTDTTNLIKKQYQRISYNAEGYIPISSRLVLSSWFNAGINFSYSTLFLNSWAVGGLTQQFRNQVTFAGLPENSVFSGSVSTAGVGMRQLLFPNGFALAKANVGYFNFYDQSNAWVKGSWLSGYSLGFGYNSILGPLELSAMYADQTKALRIYVNIGFTF